MGVPTVWTIGHSTHDFASFLRLLRAHAVEVVADVRSQPFSSRNPHFSRRTLRSSLRSVDVQYVFLGEELGGRPSEAEFYDDDGHVLYTSLAKTERFNSGLRRLEHGIDRYRVVLLCSEEDPTNCHRRLLLSKPLADRGITVLHIRGDGSVIHDRDFGRLPTDTSQGSLFGEEVSAWRSIRSASPSIPRRISSRPYDERA